MCVLRKFHLPETKIFKNIWYVVILVTVAGEQKVLEDFVYRKLLVWGCGDIWNDLFSWMMQIISWNSSRIGRKENKCVERKEEDFIWREKVFRNPAEALATDMKKVCNPVWKHNTPPLIQNGQLCWLLQRLIDQLTAATDSARIWSTGTVSTDLWVLDTYFKGVRKMKVWIIGNRKCVESLFVKWRGRSEAKVEI